MSAQGGEKMYVCALQKFSRSCADGDLLSKSPSGNIPIILPFSSFPLRASRPRLLAVFVPCCLQRNCQRGVVSFHTRPCTTAKPSNNAQPCRRRIQSSFPSKISPVAGAFSQAGGRAPTARSHTGFTWAGRASYVAECSISIVEKLLHHEVLYRKRRRRGRWKSCWHTGFHAWRLHYCARATVAKPQWRNGCCARWVFEMGAPESIRVSTHFWFISTTFPRFFTLQWNPENIVYVSTSSIQLSS